MNRIISVTAACFRYQGFTAAIGPFDLHVGAGELHLIRGRSGGGKSTLARLLCGIIPHLYRGRLEGGVRIGGRDSAAVPLWRIAETVGFVSQNPAAQVFGSTVEDEIVFGLENLGLAAAEIQARLEAALADFELEALRQCDPRVLSAGEQQRVVLAAAVARHPQVLVLDEPLALLDTSAARQAVACLQRLHACGTSLVVCDHRGAAFASLAGVRMHDLGGAGVAGSPVPALPAIVPPFGAALERVSVVRGDRRVLRDIDVELAGGRVTAVVGPNGAGKTTLLRVLAGLQPYTGRMQLDGRFGLCFENPDRQIFNATVRDEIVFGLRQVDERWYRCVLELLGLERYERTPPLLLSEGEKKRVALATVLVRPDLRGICLDEPTLGHDEGYRHRIGTVLRRLADAGYACVVATHDLEWVGRWADDIVMLDGGAVTHRALAAAPARETGCTRYACDDLARFPL